MKTSIARHTALSSIQISPNPSAGILNISNIKSPQTTLRIFTGTGSLVLIRQLNGNNTSIILSGNPGGIYLLEFSSGNEREVNKIVLR
ncbi:MAG: T9SS type A sorting domain-containing protein [Bacteroidetes bacterium]|nr:T9SS type A sorting domain-containing protein [Bacteroidota bacterium]